MVRRASGALGAPASSPLSEIPYVELHGRATVVRVTFN